jgi:acyl-CoA synthetase (AMP-forming)/AMP-acid ligase II
MQNDEGAAQNLLTRLCEEDIIRYRNSGFWQDETIYQIAARHAKKNPSKLAVTDGVRSFTYKEIVSTADILAADFLAKGLRSGDCVAIFASNRVETTILLLACSRNSLVFCPSLHHTQTADEVATLVARMGARAFFVEEGFGADADTDRVVSQVSKLDHVAKVYRLPQSGDISVSQPERLVEKIPDIVPPTGTANQIVYLPFTSGTTGEPKGVLHSNNTLLANARAMAADWKFDDSSVIYTLSPLSHNLGFGALVLSLLTGGHIILHTPDKKQNLLDRLEKANVTFVFGVPAHAIDLVAQLEKSSSPRLASVYGFRISGSAMTPSLARRLLDFGVVPQSGYGMTEACSHHYTMPDDDPLTIAETSGRACSSYEVQIFSVDDPDKPVEPGIVGQIGGRGASLMLGYFDDQQATRAAFNKGGWFMTGDLGRMDENGYLTITGRIKDIIIRGGHNIHPLKIEQLAMLYPDVERAAAVPVKDERLGEKVCIIVSAGEGKNVDPDKLLAHLQEKGLSKYDMPEYFLQMNEIPVSPTGKIVKRALVAMLGSEQNTPKPIRWSG